MEIDDDISFVIVFTQPYWTYFFFPFENEKSVHIEWMESDYGRLKGPQMSIHFNVDYAWDEISNKMNLKIHTESFAKKQ